MMRNTPIILTLLCTSLVYSSAPNAMEDPLVLDRRPGQIRVLTPLGLAKAESLQSSYDQQQERAALSFEDSDLAEAIRLSLETQSFVLPHLTESDDDPQFTQALLNSNREYGAEQSKIAEEIRQTARRQLSERKDEAIKTLQAERRNLDAQVLLLHSRWLELLSEKTILREKIANEKSEPAEKNEKKIKLLEEKLIELSDQMTSCLTETTLLNNLNNKIFDEIIYLLKGGEPRDLSWMQ